MKAAQRYWAEFSKLDFEKRHVVVEAIASMILAGVQIAIAIAVLMVTVQLQGQANRLNSAEVAMRNNQRNADESAKAANAFRMARDVSRKGWEEDALGARD